MPPVDIVFFDVDGVLVSIKSSWNHLHRYFGVYESAKEAIRMFERGDITYYEWMVIDTSLWMKSKKRITRKDLEMAFRSVVVDSRFKDVIMRLKSEGKKIVLVSGGIDVLVERVAKEVGAHECYCNRLIFDKDGYLVPGGFPIVPSGSKDIIVKKVLEKHGVPRERSAFVGDSEWDKEAFREVGLPILYSVEYVEFQGFCQRAFDPYDVYRIIKDYEKGVIDCNKGVLNMVNQAR